MKMQRVVREVMSCALITVAPDVSAAHVIQLLKRYRIGAVPVVAGGSQVIGIITEGDLARLPDLTGVSAADVMTGPVATVGEDTPAREALRLMGEHGIGRLPVLDARRRLVGIVSRRDVFTELLPGDIELRRQVVDRVIDLGGEVLNVRVLRGEVTLCGRVGEAGEIPLIERALHRIDGVVSVSAVFTVNAGERRELIRG
jgi:CBS domain-containing protein